MRSVNPWPKFDGSLFGDEAKHSFGIPRGKEGIYLHEMVPVNDEQVKAINTTHEFIGGSSKALTLIISGTNGTGKSHIGIGAVNTLMFYDGGQEAFYTNEPKLLDRITGYGKSVDYFQVYSDINLLVVDEVGSVTWTPNDKKRMEQLLNARYSNDRRTILITNLSVQELSGAFSPVIRSRIAYGEFIQLTGENLRGRYINGKLIEENETPDNWWDK